MLESSKYEIDQLRFRVRPPSWLFTSELWKKDVHDYPEQLNFKVKLNGRIARMHKTNHEMDVIYFLGSTAKKNCA